MANGPQYINDNKAVGKTITGATSEVSPTDTTTATGYATTSMVSGRQSNVWRSDTTATQYVYIDMIVAASIDTMVLHNHNISSGATVTVQYDTDDDGWADSSETSHATFTHREGSMYVTFSAISRRYWRIKFQTLNANLQIGEFVVGSITQMDKAFRWGVVETVMPHVAVAATQVGVPWFLTLAPDTRTFAISWASMTKAQQDELTTLHGLLTKGTITVIPFPATIESARSAEVYEVWTKEPLSVTINRNTDRHGGIVLIETPKNLSVS